MPLADSVAEMNAFALKAVEADKQQQTLDSAMHLRDVSITLHAVNDAFPNTRPYEFTGALDRRRVGGSTCITPLVRTHPPRASPRQRKKRCSSAPSPHTRLPTPRRCRLSAQCPNGGAANRCPGPGFNVVSGTGEVVVESFHSKTVRSLETAARSAALPVVLLRRFSVSTRLQPC